MKRIYNTHHYRYTVNEEEIQTNIAAWIAGLRSNWYTQTTCALRTPEGFCCLGVGCDLIGTMYCLGFWQLAPPRHESTPPHKNSNQSQQWAWVYMLGEVHCKEYATLPDPVLQLLGLPDTRGFAVYGRPNSMGSYEGKTLALSTLNDSGEFSFNQIADLIQWWAANGRPNTIEPGDPVVSAL